MLQSGILVHSSNQVSFAADIPVHKFVLGPWLRMSEETSLQPEPFGEDTTQPTSPMDVCDDKQDEAFLKLNEVEAQ